MKKYLYISLFLITGFSSMEARVQYVYVSPSGNDQNPGTKAQPVATLTGARDVVRGWRKSTALNDTVYVEVMPGEYFMDKPLQLSPLDAGTGQSPVVFRGQDGAPPIFYGGKETGRFEVVNPNLWRIYIPEVANYGFYFEQLYINGERRFRAQTPNRGNFNMVKRVEETVLDSTGEWRKTSFSSQKVIMHEDALTIMNELDPKELNDVLLVFYHSWDNTRKKPCHINIKDTAFYIVGHAMQPWSRINSYSRYVIENYRKALDAPGEWFLQRDGYLYYIPMPGEKPENTRCMYPVFERFITIEGDEGKSVEHIRFENLSFQVAAYQTPAGGNDQMQAAADVEATVMIDYAKNIDFLNCEIAHTGLHGIWYRKACSNSKVEHCHLYDLGGGAVKIGEISPPGDEFDDRLLSRLTSHITLHNNILHHGGYVFPCAACVTILHASDNEITHNEIADFRYSGVSAGWVWGFTPSPSKRNKIAFNHIHHLGWGELCDMGGVYTLGASEGTTVCNNVIHHVYPNQKTYYGGFGIYADAGSSYLLMENNLVYACDDAGFFQHYGKENTIRNNIFALNLKSQLGALKVEDYSSFNFTNNIVFYDKGVLFREDDSDYWKDIPVTMDNNCYWDTRTKTPVFCCDMLFAGWQKQGRDKHSIVADPLFVNPQQFDFRFKNTSVVRKIGFKPFDYSKAGVYGSDEWMKKARLCPETEKEFDRVVSRHDNGETDHVPL